MYAGGSAFRIGTVSEAGGSGLGDALASAMGQLATAHASIAELQAQLGAARAELAVRAQLHDAVLKSAVLEAKHEMQAEVSALRVERQQLRECIAKMEATWSQWQVEAQEPQCATHLRSRKSSPRRGASDGPTSARRCLGHWSHRSTGE